MGSHPIHPGKGLIGALLILLTLQSCFLSLKQVTGPSMEPNLKPGQMVFFNRMALGFQFPIIDRYGFFWKAPQEGDVVLFVHPRRDHEVIKRVALEGGAPLVWTDQGLNLGRGRVLVLNEDQKYWLRAFQEVPRGTVFVLGDNLKDSQDSRDFGFVPVEDIRGVMVF